jgi:hypothetical protein
MRSFSTWSYCLEGKSASHDLSHRVTSSAAIPAGAQKAGGPSDAPMLSAVARIVFSDSRVRLATSKLARTLNPCSVQARSCLTRISSVAGPNCIGQTPPPIVRQSTLRARRMRIYYRTLTTYSQRVIRETTWILNSRRYLEARDWKASFLRSEDLALPPTTRLVPSRMRVHSVIPS